MKGIRKTGVTYQHNVYNALDNQTVHLRTKIQTNAKRDLDENYRSQFRWLNFLVKTGVFCDRSMPS